MNATGGKKSRRNYEVIIPPSNHGYTFHYKSDAIDFARQRVDKGIHAYVKSRRTAQITHILPKNRASCSVCGNELEGKQHCPLCGELHSYR
jgi:hypothetical protein